MIDYFLHTLKEESGLNSKEKDDTDYWREYIAPFNWCGIWALDIKYISQKNGEVGYDGLILYNSYLKEPFLIKNKIWEKYNQQKGPCSVIGIPSSNEAKARIEKGSRAKPNQAFYQMFEKGAYKDNAIYAYAWKEKEGVFGSKEGYDAYYTVNKVAKEYHSAGGSWSGYKFPTGDTYSDTDSNIDRYCKQWFEGGGVDLCEVNIEEKNKIIFYQDEINGNNVYFSVIPKTYNFKAINHFSHVSKKTEEFSELYNSYKNNKPIAGINGDFKSSDKAPEGYNMNLLSPTLIEERSGKYKFSRTSLRLKNNSWYFSKENEGLTGQNLALGGGFKIIQDGNFIFDLKCYSDDLATSEVPCKIKNTVNSTRLNGEPVLVDSSKDYEGSTKGEYQTGFKSITGKSLIGITSNGSLVLADCPGYTLGILKLPNKMGCNAEQLATKMIYRFDVKEAFMVDGGSEASILYEGEVKNGQKYVPYPSD